MFQNLEKEEIESILTNNYVGQLGYVYQNRPYVVPITYYFDTEENAIICYSGEGHKMNAMRKNIKVSLLVSEIDAVTDWKSAQILGTFEQYSDSDAKAYLHKFSLGVKEVIFRKEHKKVDFLKEFSSKIYKNDRVLVFRIKVEEIIGKKRFI